MHNQGIQVDPLTEQVFLYTEIVIFCAVLPLVCLVYTAVPETFFAQSPHDALFYKGVFFKTPIAPFKTVPICPSVMPCTALYIPTPHNNPTHTVEQPQTAPHTATPLHAYTYIHRRTHTAKETATHTGKAITNKAISPIKCQHIR